MFQSINNVRGKQGDSDFSMINHPVAVVMPAGFEGKSVPASAVMMALLWQQYGLDLLHPKFNRWLEQNAPDLKSAVVQNKRGLRVGADRQVTLKISPAFDRRVREVSSDYLLWQMEPETEQVEEVVSFVYLNDLNYKQDLAHAC